MGGPGATLPVHERNSEAVESRVGCSKEVVEGHRQMKPVNAFVAHGRVQENEHDQQFTSCEFVHVCLQAVVRRGGGSIHNI